MIAATAATLLPHLNYLILKAFQQICGSSGSNFMKNKKIMAQKFLTIISFSNIVAKMGIV